MSESHIVIDEFWRWFESHRFEFDTLTDSASAFWSAAIAELKSCDKRLWFELSQSDDDDREFVITAEGHKEVFPLVETIVARAPKIRGWQFTALKPPMGFDFETTYEGIIFNPREMWFFPLENKSRPQDLGLRIGVPNYTQAIKRQAENAVLVILDTALGERAAALEIQYVEVVALPEPPEREDYVELHELPNYIEWHKRSSHDV